MTVKLSDIWLLAINLYGKRIGTITRLAGDRHIFAFDEDYITDNQRNTLSLSFKRKDGGLVTTTKQTTTRIPAFFSNLLPEGHLREYIAQKADVHIDREFFLLAHLGADLPGAITATPILEDGTEGQLPSTGQDAASDTDNDQLRFSLAGVQLKFSAIMEANGGLTIPANGVGGHWIVKLPATTYAGVPENEFAMMELARKMGIPVPETHLFPVSDIQGLPDNATAMKGSALIVERFDRKPDGSLVHIEDFAQIFGIFPADKYKHRSYANIAAVIAAEIGQDAVQDFFRRIVFSTFIGNGDMHLKNWSLTYPDGRSPDIAPAYDYVATLPYIAGDKHGLSFGRSKDLTTITQDQVRRFADTANLAPSPLWLIVEEVAETFLNVWNDHSPRENLATDVDQSISEHIQRVRESTVK